MENNIQNEENNVEQNVNSFNGNENKPQKGGKGKTIALVVILLVLLLAIGISVGMIISGNTTKVINNIEEKVQDRTESSENVIKEPTKTSKKLDESKPWVYDAEYGKNKAVKELAPSNSNKDLIVPYININSTAGKNANEEIERLYNEIYEKYATDVNEYSKNTSSISYKFYENNNILSVVIKNDNGITEGGAGRCPLYVYNFNLNTLEKATNEELLKQTGYNSISQVTEIINKWIEQEKKDENSTGNFVGLVNDKYFIDGNNKLNFVYTFVAAGTFDVAETVEKVQGEIEKQSTVTEQKVYTQSELEKMALDYYEAETGYRPSNAMTELNENGTISIRLYDDFDDHIATSIVYSVDPNTGIGTDTFDNKIDLKTKPSNKNQTIPNNQDYTTFSQFKLMEYKNQDYDINTKDIDEFCELYFDKEGKPTIKIGDKTEMQTETIFQTKDVKITNIDVAAGSVYVSFIFTAWTPSGDATGEGTIKYSNVTDNSSLSVKVSAYIDSTLKEYNEGEFIEVKKN